MGFDLYSAKEIIIKPNKDNVTFNVHVKFDGEIEFIYPRVYINKFDVDILTEN